MRVFALVIGNNDYPKVCKTKRAISQRKMAAYMRRFSLNVLQRAVEISTYKV